MGSCNNVQAGGLKVPLEGQVIGKGELVDDEEDSATENGECSWPSNWSSSQGQAVRNQCESSICITPDNLALILAATTAPLGLIVPATSYSSSEGEEDFYDAYDDPFTSIGSSPIGW